MRKFEYKHSILFFTLLFFYAQAGAQLETGAEQIRAYLPLIKGKRIGMVVNQTSMVRNTHLVDTLMKMQVKISAVFAPEHGFRGDHSAGTDVKSGRDPLTGLPVISLYGNHKKPTPEDLKNIDMVVFDIQDVGARFYTYISTLHYIMEACAEQHKKLIVLDRPNPNGYYIDGPVLDMKHKSFVGMHPVPVVHGMTIGEYAQMINGEGWLKDSLKCSLQVIKMKRYTHNTRYELPVRPSPNLPNMDAVYLYPSVCFFEGTSYSLGRGTDKPFQCVGKPGLKHGDYTFKPVSLKGIAEDPPHKNKVCKGYLLTGLAQELRVERPYIHVELLVDLYAKDSAKKDFFIDFFEKLAGTDELRKQIIAGKTAEEIRASWADGLGKFSDIRRKYLLYKDFDKPKQ